MDQHQFMNLDYPLNLDSSFGSGTPRPQPSSNSAPPSGSGRSLAMPPGIMSMSMPAHLGSQSHGASPVPGPSGGHPLMPALTGNRIVSRNLNGTLALTTQPSNDSELQLYRVLQRSNLLGYYDTFISQGGDDVQQLCEAGEEEFLEIMALVGMAAKPLHVRRLQKALQEWMQNPALFQTPLLPGLTSGHCNTLMNRNLSISQTPVSMSARQSSPGSVQVSHSPSPNLQKETSIPSPSMQSMNDGCYGNPGSPLQLTPVLVESQIQRLSDAAEQLVRTLPPFEPKPQNSKKKICKDLEHVMSMADDDPRRMDEIRKYAAIYGRFDCKRKPEKPLTLHEVSVNEAAAQICKHIPALLTRRDELFPLARQVVRDSGYHYSKGQPTDSGFRPQSASGKPLFNGASDDSGLGPLKKPKMEYPDGYSEQQHRDRDRQRRQARLEEIAEELRSLGEKGEEMKGAAVSLRNMHDYGSLHRLHQQMETLQNKQAQLMMEQSDILKIQGRIAKGRHMSNMSENDKSEETDSQYSNSGQSSPRFEISESSRDGDSQTASQKDSTNKGSQKTNAKIPKMMLQETLMDEGLRVVKEIVANQHKDGSTAASNPLTYYNDILPYNKIVASSGDSVIAVANPALCMSTALHCNTPPSPLQTSSNLHSAEKSKNNSMSALVNLSQSLGGGTGSSVKQEPVSPLSKQD